MRIVHIFRGLHDYMAELLNAQRALGDDVHACVSEADRPVVARLQPGIAVHYAAIPRVRSPSNIVGLIRLRRLLQKLHPDIVHVQSGVLWECALVIARRSYPVAFTLHDVVNHPTWGGAVRPPDVVTRFAVTAADAVIVHGSRNRARLEQRLGSALRRERIHSVEHGVILRYGTGSARRVVPDGSGNVLFFGRIDKYKGLDYLIDAGRRLRASAPNAKLVVAGSASRPDHVRGLLNGDPQITLRLGYQTDRDVAELFRWADVLVLPYIEASQSGVFQIAVAFGVPVVATAVGGLPDVVHHGRTGLLVAPADPERLANALYELLANAALRTKVIDELRIDRESRFNWARISRDTAAIYAAVVASFRSRREPVLI